MAVVDILPSPVNAQALRMPFILHPSFKGSEDTLPDPTPLETAVYNCHAGLEEKEVEGSDTPVVAYISKMFSVPRDMLPQNRRRSLTAEEMRERGREIRQARMAAAAAVAAGSAAIDRANDASLGTDAPTPDSSSPAVLTSSSTPEEDQDKAEEEGDGLEDESEKEEEEEEVLLGLARIYSGTIRVGQQLQILGPKYDIKNPHLHTQTITISSLYMVMGRELTSLDVVPAGNIFAIGGLGSTVLKTATLVSPSSNCPSLGTLRMVSAPIVRVAIEPAHPSQGAQLARGLRLLSMADACVEVVMQETGEQVLLTTGELHLERCLKDLKERFAKIDIHVSPPIVPFRETAVEHTETDSQASGEGEDPQGKKGRSVTVTGVQGRYTLRLSARPLPPKVLQYLQSHSLLLKSLLSDSGANRSSSRPLGKDELLKNHDLFDTGDETQENLDVQISYVDEATGNNPLEAFTKGLREAFAQSQDPEGIWGKDVVERIWAFGPKHIGPNLLLSSSIPTSARRSFLGRMGNSTGGEETQESPGKGDELHEFNESLLTGFQLATYAGPLCAEPVVGMAYIVENFSLTNAEDTAEQQGAEEASERTSDFGKYLCDEKEIISQKGQQVATKVTEIH